MDKLTNLTRITLLLFFILFISRSELIAQSFVNINAQLTGLSNSSSAWGDFDNDKDPDLIISGESSDGSFHIKLYRNSNGIFEEEASSFAGIKNGSIKWGDYDNDGDIDLLATGNNAEEKTTIYRNEGDTFIDIAPGFLYFGAYSHGTWTDYDNDGDLDVFISGSWNSKLYRNDGQDVFTDTEIEFIALTSSRACWADNDNDGDKDLLVTGDTGGGMKLYYYENNQGAFNEFELGNMGLSSGSVEWGDYDSDGDLDILITGFNDNVEPEAHIYRNEGNHVYTNIYAGLPPVAMGNACWGDSDNDGDLDIAITGKLAGCGATVSAIYENQGNGNFNDINTFLTNAERSSLCWGDYDNDTDLDLFLSGKDNNGNNFSRIYRNDFSLPNLFPWAPDNLTSEMLGDEVVLSWDEAFDSQTPQNSLTYNIRIGLAPLESGIIMPMAYLEDGYRMIPDFGNTGNNNHFTVKNLEPGLTYYWSVQTIDNAFGASVFSEEQSFYLPYTSVNHSLTQFEEVIIHPNPARDFISINFGIDEKFNINITTIDGKQVIARQIINGEKIDISGLVNGIYLLRIDSEGKIQHRKFIKY